MVGEQTIAFCNRCDDRHEAELLTRNHHVIATVHCPKGEYEYAISSNPELFLKFREKSSTDISAQASKGLRYVLNYVPITNACNFGCTICGADALLGAKGAVFLSVEEICQRALQVKRDGGYLLNLTGGEPTLHPELLEIVRRVGPMGLSLGMNTNGFLLGRRKDLAASLKRAGLRRVIIQFDSFREDNLRKLGREYLEEKRAAIRNAIEAGLGVGLNCLVTRHNLPEVSDLLAHGLDLGRHVINVAFATPAPTGRYLLSQANVPDREEVVMELLKVGERYHFSLEDLLPLPTCLPWGIQRHPDCAVHVIFLRTPNGIRPLNHYVDMEKLYRLLSRIDERNHFLNKYVLPLFYLLRSIRKRRLPACLRIALGLLLRSRRYSLVNVGIADYNAAAFLDDKRISRCAAAFYTSAGPVKGCLFAFRGKGFPGSLEYEKAQGGL